MSRCARILGLVSWLIGVALAGCMSPKAGVLEGFKSSPTQDMQDREKPRISRSQAPPPAAPALAPDAKVVKVLAWVNGKPIFDDDLVQAFGPQVFRVLALPPTERAKTLAGILNQMIDQELLYQDAIHKLESADPKGKTLKKLKKIAKEEFDKHVRRLMEKMSKDLKREVSEEEFQEQLRAQGVTMEAMERFSERKFFATEYLRSRVFPQIQMIGHQDVLEYYNQHKNQFQRVDSVKWQDLFIAIGPKHPTREEARSFAEDIVARLKRGEEFKDFLQFDEGDSHLRQGEGIGKRREEIRPPELAEELFKLGDNEVGPIVELPTGFHVFRVVKREHAGQIPFDVETQKTIGGTLKNEIAERETKRLVSDLRSRAVVEIEKD
jgi:hypothetical protein